MEDYLRQPEIIQRPGREHAPETRKFQGIPSLACGPGGFLYAVWYAGVTPGEDHNNYVVFAVSEDSGRTWSEELVIDPDGGGPVRAFDPQIWMAPDGKLRLFWAQGLDNPNKIGPCGVWVITAEKGGHPDFRKPRPERISDGVMMCKPLVFSTGEWCLPVSFWHRREGGSAAVLVSHDGGMSWDERGACDVPPDVRRHDEHMVVELSNGILWMLVRTRYGIGESFSRDRGRTWSELKPSNIPHPDSRFFLRRPAPGRLLLVRNNPPPGGFADGSSKGTRSHMTAFLSEDDGRSWPHSLLIDEREAVSYPDGDQAEDGTVYLVYDRERRKAREILVAVFREEDILGGGGVDAGPRGRRLLVSKAGRGGRRCHG